MSDNVLDARMTLENSGFVSAMGRAREATSKAMEVMKGAMLGVTGLGGAFAAFRGVEGVMDGVFQAFERGRQLMDLSRQTTTNVRDLVILQQAFRDAGASADSVGHTIFMLQKALGGVSEEGLPTAHIFAQMGLNMGELKRLDTVSQFQAIAKSLNNLRDPSAQSAAAMQIFGRSASEVMGLLRDPEAFANATKNVGGIGSVMERNAAAFDQVSKSLELIKTNVEGLFAGLAGNLAPALQSVADKVNGIDFTRWGQRIGESVQMIVAAFTSGKITDIVGLSLKVGFEEAVNVLYGAIYGLAGALQAEFSHVPQLLRDAFGMLTNGNFWKGIGELLLGAFMSIQSRLAQVFIFAADALGNRLADVLDHIPFLKDVVEKLRGNLNAGAQVASSAFAGSAAQGDKMVAAGASNIAGASGNLGGDYFATLNDELKSFVGAFKANKAFDTSGDLKKLSGIIEKIHDSIKPRPIYDQPPAPGKGGGAGLGRQEAFKAPEADRLTKIGLFVGHAPAAPGLAEARRTAAATEKANQILKVIEGHLTRGGFQPSHAAYAD